MTRDDRRSIAARGTKPLRSAFAGVAIAALAMTALCRPAWPQAAPAPQGQAARANAVAAAPAALPDSPDAYRIAADEWLRRYKPATFALVIKRGGRIVYSRAEKTTIEQPTLLASLSKMITAVCIATLVRDDKLDFDTPMRDALSGFFARNGAPKDKRLLNVTVAQLLTHRSGLMGNPDGDVMLAIVRRLAGQGKAGQAAIQAMLAEHVKHPLKRDPGAAYAYSNSGYLALGAIIEDRSKRPYEDYCRDAVMKPLNIASARLHPDWRVWSSMGGWTISPADYLAIADVLSPDNPFLGDKAKAWIDSSRAIGGGGLDWYSLGVFTSSARGRWSVSHGGQLNSRGVDSKRRPISAVIRATFARAPDGAAMFAAFTPSHYDNKALDELRSGLGRATVAWKSFR